MADAPTLLVKVSGDAGQFLDAARKSQGIAPIRAEPILTVTATGGPRKAPGVAPTTPSTWLRISQADTDGGNPWDKAHALLNAGQPLSLSGMPGVEAVEPDLPQQWPVDRQGPGSPFAAAPDMASFCSFDGQDGGGKKAVGPDIAWNFGGDYSQLAAARQAVGDKMSRILIAHLDTGYDPAHHLTQPKNLKLEWQRNFVSGEGSPDNAGDHIPENAALNNHGHGTGTLSLLAGNKLNGNSPGWKSFSDYVGGAPLANILPVRIADWVVRFTTGTIVQGIDYARQREADVVSMSMGGLSSQALADAVNMAYEAGLVLVTAAGNNFANLPVPSIVYPARFRRVLAACGVMADGRAYTNLALGTMQGNYGPDSKMDTALGAYTPNVPWAQIDCGNVVDMDGAGTSAATPQIAAAAALWLAEHWEKVQNYSEKWMRVEAVRHALFTAAAKTTAKMNAQQTRKTIGQGVMRASDALQIQPLSEAELKERKLPPASSTLGWLDGVFGGGVSLAADDVAARRQRMLALELTQLCQKSLEVDSAIDDPDVPIEYIPVEARNRFLEAALDTKPSKMLEAFLTQLLGRASAAPTAGRAPTSTASVKRKAWQPPVPNRRLRVFALDPSVAQSLASVAVNETTLSIPWDDSPETSEPLRPGPIGEYIEVVDVDPASNRFYEPVDLNSKILLAQDGWSPSEGNPQFHQQMVYAVAMTTIRHFELALGRRALWSPRFARINVGEENERQEMYEVPKLRIYPHAFRGQNAYYSPEKKALLFGYFIANSREGDSTPTGSMVFSCLSSDIIAHETTHALLDGLHRRFQEASNPDVPAFHEAFADIVALFQHFTVTELVRFEIARAKGKFEALELLSGLAKQFGEGGSRGGPLRDYADNGQKKMRYEDTTEPHDRGSILVFAVYEAFLNIVNRRVSDLFRIASNGTGILPEGALHPDLVDRLTTETCKTAQQVLRMCIRALDYLPPVDVTFGEYLRALITADVDVVSNDRFGYRTAFMEAFRNRGILPRNVRTISQESLMWGSADNSQPAWLPELLTGLDLSWDQEADRSKLFKQNHDNCWVVWNRLHKIFAADPTVMQEFGLAPDVPRYEETGHILREAKGTTTFEVHSIRPARRHRPDGTFLTDVIAVVTQRQAKAFDEKNVDNGFYWFRGGATIIIEQSSNRQRIRYIVLKNSASASRDQRQQQSVRDNIGSPLRSLYFGRTKDEPFAILHADFEVLDHG
ncbi:S8 family serine peptidase [Rhizobium ruizarguesonis]|uniref:S8 family serine peptidase n=1 Tax=Rhizobium ruizarguesonis TaxID=2081791 RepID=UPI0010314C43|nr:S8 family serine peptidase [Rhizobium ruizarguesonis]TAT71057.1 peptidase S8 [Rhizobium ruizarguesonis]